MIGSDAEPGITARVDSGTSLSVTGTSAGTPLLVGGADLESGTEVANEVVTISNVREARRSFGPEESSHLTQAILDAMNNGASPVLACACEENQRSMALDTLETKITEVGEPMREELADVTITVGGTEATLMKTIYDLNLMGPEMSPDQGEAVVNLATNRLMLPEIPSTGEIEYTALDYQAALEAVVRSGREHDFLGVLKEGQAFDAYNTAEKLAAEETFVLAIAGAGPMVTPDDYTNTLNSSRIQLIAPSRTEIGRSMIGAVVGKRAEIGLSTTLINQRVDNHARAEQSLNQDDRGTMIDNYVTPMKTIGRTSKVKDDLTTVDPQENTEEANFRFGFSRLAVDFLVGVTISYERQFIGEFNSPGVIGQMQDLLTEDARALKDSAIVYDYTVDVSQSGPTTLTVDFRADVAEPIRFIENEFTIGQELN